MKFQVPQFIEVEDKIFGPLTFKQFLYVAGGIGACVLAFTFLPTFIAILLALPIAALAGALAFYKYNSKPFVNFLESFFNYNMKNKLYVWRKTDNPQPTADKQQKAEIQQVYVPKLSESKLRDLTWSLDIKETANPVTREKEPLKDGL